jgi:hypothetical protein
LIAKLVNVRLSLPWITTTTLSTADALGNEKVMDEALLMLDALTVKL